MRLFRSIVGSGHSRMTRTRPPTYSEQQTRLFGSDGAGLNLLTHGSRRLRPGLRGPGVRVRDNGIPRDMPPDADE